MGEQKPKRRILIGLNASRVTEKVQEIAAQIASFFNAEINGLFVEDINLIHLAQLPFAEEIRTITNKTFPLDVEDMQRRLKTEATLLRYELEQMAIDHELEWTFDVVRGLVTQELLRAAKDADLLILGRFSQQRRFKKGIGSTALTAVQQADSPVLIVTPEINFYNPLLLLYDGSSAAEQALRLSIALVQTSKQIQIILSSNDEAELIRCKNRIANILNSDDIYYSFHLPTSSNQNHLIEIIQDVQPSIIVYGHGADTAWTDAVELLLHATNYPLLIVRGHEEMSFS